MSRQIAIGAVVGFALAVFALSAAERSARSGAAPSEPDAGLIAMPLELQGPRAHRVLEAEEPPVRDGRRLGRPSLIMMLLADGGR